MLRWLDNKRSQALGTPFHWQVWQADDPSAAAADAVQAESAPVAPLCRHPPVGVSRAAVRPPSGTMRAAPAASTPQAPVLQPLQAAIAMRAASHRLTGVSGPGLRSSSMQPVDSPTRTALGKLHRNSVRPPSHSITESHKNGPDRVKVQKHKNSPLKRMPLNAFRSSSTRLKAYRKRASFLALAREEEGEEEEAEEVHVCEEDFSAKIARRLAATTSTASASTAPMQRASALGVQASASLAGGPASVASASTASASTATKQAVSTPRKTSQFGVALEVKASSSLAGHAAPASPASSGCASAASASLAGRHASDTFWAHASISTATEHPASTPRETMQFAIPTGVRASASSSASSSSVPAASASTAPASTASKQFASTLRETMQFAVPVEGPISPGSMLRRLRRKTTVVEEGSPHLREQLVKQLLSERQDLGAAPADKAGNFQQPVAIILDEQRRAYEFYEHQAAMEKSAHALPRSISKSSGSSSSSSSSGSSSSASSSQSTILSPEKRAKIHYPILDPDPVPEKVADVSAMHPRQSYLEQLRQPTAVAPSGAHNGEAVPDQYVSRYLPNRGAVSARELCETTEDADLGTESSTHLTADPALAATLRELEALGELVENLPKPTARTASRCNAAPAWSPGVLRPGVLRVTPALPWALRSSRRPVMQQRVQVPSGKSIENPVVQVPSGKSIEKPVDKEMGWSRARRGQDEKAKAMFVGEAIEGYWPDDAAWLPASVAVVYADGSLRITWAADGSESDVPFDYVQKAGALDDDVELQTLHRGTSGRDERPASKPPARASLKQGSSDESDPLVLTVD